MNKNKKPARDRKPTTKQSTERPNKYVVKGGSHRSCDEMVKEGVNDISWYSRNPELMRDAGSVSFSDILGLPTDFGRPVVGPTGATLSSLPQVIPGVCRLGYLPCFGISQNASSSVNTTSRMVYAFIRHANSGSRNYEAPDYMTYLLAMSSIYTFHSEMVRLYGICRTYSVVNRYIAKGLVSSLGYDYDDITKNLSSLRYYINYFAARVNSFAVPKSLYLYDRHAFLPMHVYKDANDDKTQLFVLQPDYLYKWSGTAYDTGSALIATRFAGENRTYANIVAMGDDLIEALMSNEDIGIMSGDTLKAFGAEGCRTLLAVPEDYATLPIYDEEVLTQIHNATFSFPIGKVPGYESSADLTQENGYLIFNPLFDVASSLNPQIGQVIDSKFTNPSPEFVMIATRFKVVPNGATFVHPEGRGFTLNHCGTELITSALIFKLDSDGEAIEYGSFTVDAPRNCTLGNDATPQEWAPVSNFDWCPLHYVDLDSASNSVSFTPFGDIFNYTTISDEVLGKLHNVALMSLLEVPGMGKPV